MRRSPARWSCRWRRQPPLPATECGPAPTHDLGRGPVADTFITSSTRPSTQRLRPRRFRAVPGEVVYGQRRPVRVRRTARRHPRCRAASTATAGSARYPAPVGHRNSYVVDDRGTDAGQRAHGRTGLARGHAGQRADHHRRFRSATRCPRWGRRPRRSPSDTIHASGLIDSPTEPSSRSEDRSYCCGEDLLAPLHERADRRGRCVDGSTLCFDDLPPAALVRGVGVPS